MKTIRFEILVLLLACGAFFVQSAPMTLTPKQFPPDGFQVSRYIVPSNYPGYFVYNYLQIGHDRGIPIAIFADGSPGVIDLQPTYTYYGTPIYDYRYQFNQLFPGSSGHQPPISIPSGQPSFPTTAQGPTIQPTTQKPPYEDDGIEKLDEKFDPSLEGNDDPSREDDDDDSVTIDAI